MWKCEIKRKHKHEVVELHTYMHIMKQIWKNEIAKLMSS